MNDYTSVPVPTGSEASQYDGVDTLQFIQLANYQASANNVIVFGELVIDRDLVQGVRGEFELLKRDWETATQNLSAFDQIVSHPSYQAIIKLGKRVVPILLEELRVAPAHWFYALRKITGAAPIPKSAAGDFAKMTDAWLKWGRQNGYG